LRELVREVAADATHPEWPRLLEFLSTLGTLPASTFDVTSALAAEPAAAALALLRMRGSAALWEGLEQLPFMWALIPADVWLGAARLEFTGRKKRLAALADEDDPGSPDEALMHEFAAEAPHRAPWMSCIVELMHRVVECVPALPDPQLQQLLVARCAQGRAVLLQVLADVGNVLVKAHDGVWWPRVETEEFTSVGRELPGEFWSEPPQLYQTAVMKAPLLAAAASARNRRLSAEGILEQRRLRAFDERWFDNAYRVALAYLLGLTLEKYPEQFR
jgi:hypothetical protein